MKKCPKCGSEFENNVTLCPSDGAALETQGDALIGRTLAGKYRVDEAINEGGMGTVYQATHILMDKRVAIKVLHPALAADSVIVARFSREARAASRISHPHAISVTDFGESEDGIVFLVMEFLHGKTLKEIVKESGPLPLARVVEIMRQVCGALEAAHSENIVHRDLKSDNIMLIDVAEGDWVKVLDFGIAKIQEPGSQDPELTSPDLIIGTPHYMSPEQCSKDSEIDARSDVYSLGVILFELLTGHVPFTGESATAVMFKHIHEAAPNLQTERDDLPPEVAQVVARALAKQQENRFQSVKELRESLTLASGHSPLPQDMVDVGVRDESHPSHRIVISTETGEEARDYDEDLDDETTVVQSGSLGEGPGGVGSQPQAANTSTANSWRVAAIALLGVLVIGGVLFVMTRGRESAADKQGPPLTADPNSQPVKTSGAPTGQAERDIAPSTTAENVNSNLNANTSNTNQNDNSSSITGGTNTNENANSSNNSNLLVDDANNNSNPSAASPTPKPTLPKAIGSPRPPPPTSTAGP